MSLPSFNLIGQQTTELLKGLCFLTFQGLCFQTSKCWEIQQWMQWQPSFYISRMSLDLNNVSTKFQLDWPANNRIIEWSLFSHFSGSLFSDFSKCWEVQQWMRWQPSFYISKMSLDINNVSTIFQLDWPAKNRIFAGSLFLTCTFQGLCFQTFQYVGKYSSGCDGNQVSIFRR